jgi:hypothetical protein
VLVPVGEPGLSGDAADRPSQTASTSDSRRPSTILAGGMPRPETLRWSRVVAANLAIPRARFDYGANRGLDRIVSAPYDATSDDIDLDRTLERMHGLALLSEEGIVVRVRRRAEREIVLAVDMSGSMHGNQLQTAAAAVGGLASQLPRAHLAIIAFWQESIAILTPFGADFGIESLVDSMCRIQPRGTTDLSLPLEFARKLLAKSPALDARVVLLSDCLHNASSDPVRIARAIPRLDVLLDISQSANRELGDRLSVAGNGHVATVTGYGDVSQALAALFGQSG